MTGLLLWKEHLKGVYGKYSQAIRPVIRFLFALCTFIGLNTNLGYMVKLKNPLIVAAASLICAVLPWGVTAFLAGCLMVAHVYSVSMEMALIALVLLLVVGVLYYSFKPGDSYLLILVPMAFLLRIPYAVPILVGLGSGLASVVPVGCGVFIYYQLLYVKQNAGVLTSETSVDMVQKYTQIIKSVVLNQTMLVMVAVCAVGIVVVYMIRRLSMDYAWMAAIVAGLVAELFMLFIGDFVFGVSVNAMHLILGMAFSALLAVIFNFFWFSVDYTRTEYVQFEDDDYYYYVKAVPKMAVSTTDVKVQKISSRKRSVRDRGANE